MNNFITPVINVESRFQYRFDGNFGRYLNDDRIVFSQSVTGFSNVPRTFSAPAELLRIDKSDDAANPAMRYYDNRLNSFINWPLDNPVKPEKLCKAGFYYVNNGDDVKCFYCNGGLQKWESSDDPWAMHARWFPHCKFLIETKGQKFVEGCNLDSVPSSSLEKLRRDRTCKVCLEKESYFVFIPCGHLVACARCAGFLKNCPICRKFINDKIKVFFA